MKICCKCKKEKNLDDFSNAKSNLDGKDAYCKECRRKTSKEYRERNKDSLRIYGREYKRKVNNSKPNRYIKKEKETATIVYALDNYKKEEGYIYLIKETFLTNRVKIGKTKNVMRRINSMRSIYAWENPVELIFSLKTKEVNRREKELHMLFDEKRAVNEWFELDENDIKWAIEFLQKDRNVTLEEIFEIIDNRKKIEF